MSRAFALCLSKNTIPGLCLGNFLRRCSTFELECAASPKISAPELSNSATRSTNVVTNASMAAIRGARLVHSPALFAALGRLLCGYDTGVPSGALICMKRDFALPTLAEEGVVSGVLLGAPSGAIFGGKMADHFGRRWVLLVSASSFGIGALASAL